MSYQISGYVLNIYGFGIENVEMVITGHDSVYTTSNGYWEATVEGTVTITPEIYGWVFTPISRTAYGASTNINFEGRNTKYQEYVSGISGKLSQMGWNYTVKGTITDHENQPMENVEVMFVWTMGNKQFEDIVLTDENGEYEKEMLIGEMKVIPSKIVPFANAYGYYPFTPEETIVDGNHGEIIENIDFQAGEVIPYDGFQVNEPGSIAGELVGIEWEFTPELYKEHKASVSGIAAYLTGITWVEIIEEYKSFPESVSGMSAKLEGIEWEFIVTAPPYEITGTIRDWRGSPMENVKITAIRQEDNHSYPPVYTDSNGEYLKQNIHHTCRIIAEKDGWVFEPDYHEISYYESGLNFTGYLEGIGFLIPEIFPGNTFVFDLPSFFQDPRGKITLQDYYLYAIASTRGKTENKLFASKGKEEPHPIIIFGQKEGLGEDPPQWEYFTKPLLLNEVIPRRLEVECTGEVTVTLIYDEQDLEQLTFDSDGGIVEKNLEGIRADQIVFKFEGTGEAKLHSVRLFVIPLASYNRSIGGEDE